MNNNKQSSLSSVMDHLLSNTLFPPRRMNIDNENEQENSDDTSSERQKDPLASKVWRMYTKAKDTLPNGARMENLTWRMMAMTLTKKKLSEEANAQNINETDAIDDSMDIDHQYVDTSIKYPTTPPAADDTTGLLSSSAPPYTMMNFFKENSKIPEEQMHPYEQQMHHDNIRNNVMVFGSTRAINTSDVPKFTPVKRRNVYDGQRKSTANNSITIPSLDEEDEEDEQEPDTTFSLNESHFQNSFSQSVPSHSYFMQKNNSPQRTDLMLGDTSVYNNRNVPTSIPYQPTSPLNTNNATPTLLQHNMVHSFQPSSPPILTNSSFYFNINSSLPNSPMEYPTQNTTLVSESPALLTNPGSLSFEDILNVYYNNNNDMNMQPSDTLENTTTPGILNLQSIHLSSSNGNSTTSASPPSISSPHSMSSSDYQSPDEDEDLDSVQQNSTKKTGKYKRNKISGMGRQQQQKPGMANAVKTRCSNCQTSTTPLWRRDPQGNPLCNACGLFLKLHGAVRPLSLKTDVIKKRNRSNTNTDTASSPVNVTKSTQSNPKAAKLLKKQELKKDELKKNGQLMDRRNTVHIAPQASSASMNRPILSARPTLLSKRQRRTSEMISSKSNPVSSSTTSSTNNNSFGAIPFETSPSLMPKQPEQSLTPQTTFPKSMTTTFSSTSSAPNPVATSPTADSLPQTEATNAAVQAILQSIGIHLDSLPVELLPLIASAANYHAANKQRLQGQQQQQQQLDLNSLLSNIAFQQNSKNN